ncbi:hypothetical protein [Pedobacter sp. MR22-3]|uniref:hypothetical protein n=1 Tax=Pedobacter sp. MR22-3 TaxID=2994552 RepID=UPI0022479032|nr:hypothetical protein [Pedobacter sp. MR22-3]MCX2584794.1 hypothetical protein [Pedobacter sp. MR22-3]
MEQTDTLEKLRELQVKYLMEAEELFGPKTECNFAGVMPGNVSSPKFCYAAVPYDRSKKAFMIIINLSNAEKNFKDGILQISHEVVHMLSPEKDDNDKAVNYLEEGMATYFSKIITDRETSDQEFATSAIKGKEKYNEAFELYLSLHEIDKDAVKKLRLVNPSLASLTALDFRQTDIKIEEEMIERLLRKF